MKLFKLSSNQVTGLIVMVGSVHFMRSMWVRDFYFSTAIAFFLFSVGVYLWFESDNA